MNMLKFKLLHQRILFSGIYLMKTHNSVLRFQNISTSRLCPTKGRNQWGTGLQALKTTHGSFPSVSSKRSLNLASVEPSAVGFNDYEKECKEFQLAVPQFYNFSVDVIDRWAKAEQIDDVRRHQPALWVIDDNTGKETKWNFGELSEKSQRVANMLTGPCGLLPGDRIVVIMAKIPQWWLINIAAIRTGTVLIPGTNQLTAKDIEQRLQKSQAKCVICDSVTADKVEQVLDNCPSATSSVVVNELSQDRRHGWLNFQDIYNSSNPVHIATKTRADDPMTIFFTSGTTGEPKMAEHSHASYGLAHKITGKYWLDLLPYDIHWCQSDTGWAKAAWSNLFAPWLQGACVFIHNSARFDPKQTLQILEDYPITTLCCAPTAYRMLVQENLQQRNFKSVRHCVSAGEPLNPEVIERWQDGTGLLIREGYGQTETILQLATFRCIPMKPGAIGKPPPGIDVNIVDEDGNELAPGEEGNIGVKVKPTRPIGLFTHYVGEPEKTAASFRGDYYLSGDKAVVDEDGYFWFVGRADDIIISAGYRIGPFEVENALIEHPAVLESAVISSPDPLRGEVVKAIIVLTELFKSKEKEQLKVELQEHVKTTTAPYKYPRKIEFRASLPKTVSGKIRRVELRDNEWNTTH